MATVSLPLESDCTGRGGPLCGPGVAFDWRDIGVAIGPFSERRDRGNMRNTGA